MKSVLGVPVKLFKPEREFENLLFEKKFCYLPSNSCCSCLTRKSTFDIRVLCWARKVFCAARVSYVKLQSDRTPPGLLNPHFLKIASVAAYLTELVFLAFDVGSAVPGR